MSDDARPRSIAFHAGALTPSGGSPARLVVGALLALLGAVKLVAGASAGAWSALVGAPLLALGGLLVAARTDIEIDRVAGVVTWSWALQPLTLRRRRYALAEVTGVDVEVTSTNEAETRYYVVLLLTAGRRMVLDSIGDPRTARAEGERVARFCGVTAHVPPELA